MISSQLITRSLLLIAVLLLTLTANAGQFPIPDSGQTKCYDDAGDEINPCPQPGEPFYGQDPNYSINPRSYTKDGLLAHSIYIGGEGVEASEPPVIIEVHPRVELPENVASTTLWVKTSQGHDAISKVRAVLIRPGFSPSDYQGESTPLFHLWRGDWG